MPKHNSNFSKRHIQSKHLARISLELPKNIFQRKQTKKKHPPMNATLISLCHDKVHFLKNKTNTKKPPMNATFISLCHDKVHFLRSALRWAFAGIACQASMAISTPASHAWYVCNSFQMKLTWALKLSGCLDRRWWGHNNNNLWQAIVSIGHANWRTPQKTISLPLPEFSPPGNS